MWQYKAIVVLLTVFAAMQVAFATFPVCHPPDGPNNGGFQPKNAYYSVGHSIKFFCNEGYDLHGAPWSVCKFNARTRKAFWHAEPPVCKRMCIIINLSYLLKLCEPIFYRQSGYLS